MSDSSIAVVTVILSKTSSIGGRVAGQNFTPNRPEHLWQQLTRPLDSSEEAERGRELSLWETLLLCGVKAQAAKDGTERSSYLAEVQDGAKTFPWRLLLKNTMKEEEIPVAVTVHPGKVDIVPNSLQSLHLSACPDLEIVRAKKRSGAIRGGKVGRRPNFSHFSTTAGSPL